MSDSIKKLHHQFPQDETTLKDRMRLLSSLIVFFFKHTSQKHPPKNEGMKLLDSKREQRKPRFSQ
jgi:hypothetical protein